MTVAITGIVSARTWIINFMFKLPYRVCQSLQLAAVLYR